MSHRVPVSKYLVVRMTGHITQNSRKIVINWLDPIEKLYDMYSEEEDTLRIVEVTDDGLDFDSDIEDGPADLYLKL